MEILHFIYVENHERSINISKIEYIRDVKNIVKLNIDLK